MADLTITATSVVQGASGISVLDGILGASVTAGQSVYLDTAASTYKLADANASSTTAQTAGIALNGGASGQPVKVLASGPITIGATVTVGTIYVQSATAGGIAPAADLATGHYVTILGVGISASQIQVGISKSGVAVP